MGTNIMRKEEKFHLINLCIYKNIYSVRSPSFICFNKLNYEHFSLTIQLYKYISSFLFLFHSLVLLNSECVFIIPCNPKTCLASCVTCAYVWRDIFCTRFSFLRHYPNKEAGKCLILRLKNVLIGFRRPEVRSDVEDSRRRAVSVAPSLPSP